MFALGHEKSFSEVLEQDLALPQVNKQILKGKKNQADLHLVFVSTAISPASILSGDVRPSTTPTSSQLQPASSQHRVLSLDP